MKKKLLLLMSVVMLTGLTGCGLLRDDISMSLTREHSDEDEDDDDDEDDDKDDYSGYSADGYGYGDDYGYGDGYELPAGYESELLPDNYSGQINTSSDTSLTNYNMDPLEFADLNTNNLSEAEAVGVSVRNDRLVLKYTGKENVCGESSLYYVLGGFFEDGDVNWITGTSRFWYFFDSDAAYNIAFEAAKKDEDILIEEYNPTSRYFSVIGFFDNDWETYDGIVKDVDNGVLPAAIPPSPHYIVVK